MTAAEYTIPLPKKYPKALEDQGPHKGPLRVIVADNKYAYGDPESVGLMLGEVVSKYGTNEQAVEAYESALLQADPGYQKRRRRQAVREWFTARRPVIEMLEVQDNEGVLTGYRVVMSLRNPETGLSEVYTRFVSQDELMRLA